MSAHGASLPARSLPRCSVAAWPSAELHSHRQYDQRHHEPMRCVTATHLRCAVHQGPHGVLVEHTGDGGNDDDTRVVAFAQQFQQGRSQEVDTYPLGPSFATPTVCFA